MSHSFTSSSSQSSFATSTRSASSSDVGNLTQNITGVLTSQLVSLPFSGSIDASSAQSLVGQINFDEISGTAGEEM